MFGRKKKVEETKKGSVYIHFNEGLYKTKSGEVVRFTNIDVYFDVIEEADIKNTMSSDMVRTIIIEQCYGFTLSELIDSKDVFLNKMLSEINGKLDETGVKCTSFTIDSIDKVY